jgi:D-cysteine desulfhydrase family pyridoxal phosphate-dependent enzyme
MERREVHHAASRLASVPRLNCGFYPTPIEELPRLRAALGGGPRLFIKRDDFTGAGCGGNKVRKLEYVLAQVIADGAEIAVTTGSEKSNHARVTAMLCARFGLRSILVLNSLSGSRKPATRLIDEMAGAEIHLVQSREERRPTAAVLVAELRREGRRVAEIPIGASVPLGALGYVRAARELAGQLAILNVRPNYIFLASSSGGTQAGLVTGCQLFGLESMRIIGVSPDDPAESIAAEVSAIVNGTRQLLDLPPVRLNGEVTVVDEYIGPGYSFESAASYEALQLLARTEGILLDPVYTAKAMAALIDWIRRGRLTEEDSVLFWHTGGQLALFYAPE